jgi:DNA-binding MarR family transcriptional regulator
LRPGAHIDRVHKGSGIVVLVAGRARDVSERGVAGATGRSADPVDWVEHWWTKQGFPDTERFVAMTSVLRAHQLLTDCIGDVLKRFDLTVNSYFLVLSVLLSDNGGLLLSQLARRITVHPTTVTLLTDRLESQGLLVREPHPTDRRATFAKITPAGRALANDATRALADIHFGVPHLTEGGAKQLVALLRPVRADLGDLTAADADGPSPSTTQACATD